jgi:hypothetical protein
LDILSAIIGAIGSVFAYSLLFAGVYKLFLIGNDLGAIKKLLSDRAREHEALPLNAVLKE